MIVVSVLLLSARDGSATELARMHISNIGGTDTLGNYDAETLRGRSTADLNRRIVQRKTKVLGHPRLSQHVWNLIAKALTGMGYGGRK